LELLAPWGLAKNLEWGEPDGRHGRTDPIPARLAELDRLSRRKPRSPWPLFFTMTLKHTSGRLEEAQPQMSRLKRFGRRYDWMRTLSPVLWYAEADAVPALKRIVRRRPRLWWARGQLAEALVLRGRVEDGLARMREAVELAPHGSRELGDMYEWMGKLLLRSGRYRDAVAYLEKAKDFGTAWAYGWLGAALVKLERCREALPLLDIQLYNHLPAAEALVWRGEAHRLLGRHREALDDLNRALRLQDNVWALLNRALLHAEQGKLRSMRADFERIPHGVLRRLKQWSGIDLSSSTDEARLSFMRACLELAKGDRSLDFYCEIA
jgi:tetratricopeptide (TPR) repeat protein